MDKKIQIEHFYDQRFYNFLAAKLAADIGRSRYYNGKVSHCIDNIFCSVSCTLLLGDGIANDFVVPVHWEFRIVSEGKPLNNDLSWREFSPYLLLALGRQ